MSFRGPKAHPNRQRISGKLRRKFMSVPGLQRIPGRPSPKRLNTPQPGPHPPGFRVF
jgi:hypothetical protein